LETNTYSSISPISFTIQGIESLLSNLDPNKAPGPDQIPSYILKHCAQEFAPILKVIFTQSLSSSSLPKDWLTANISPIFKKGTRNNPANYRPISLTSVCCKTMEHIISHHIMSHLQSNHILTNQQHGFRPGFSCQTQLIALVEDLQRNMDNHCQVDLILLDFAKAFNRVPHQHLLLKLSNYGITGDILEWIKT